LLEGTGFEPLVPRKASGVVLVSSVALWEAGMILRQFLHTDPVAISYLFGCGGRAVSRSPDRPRRKTIGVLDRQHLFNHSDD
jgi:hypothetical protein